MAKVISEKVQFRIDKRIIGGDTSKNPYYVYLRELMNNKGNNIFSKYCYWDGKKFSKSNNKVDNVREETIPKILEEFKVIVKNLTSENSDTKTSINTATGDVVRCIHSDSKAFNTDAYYLVRAPGKEYIHIELDSNSGTNTWNSENFEKVETEPLGPKDATKFKPGEVYMCTEATTERFTTGKIYYINSKGILTDDEGSTYARRQVQSEFVRILNPGKQPEAEEDDGWGESGEIPDPKPTADNKIIILDISVVKSKSHGRMRQIMRTTGLAAETLMKEDSKWVLTQDGRKFTTSSDVAGTNKNTRTMYDSVTEHEWKKACEARRSGEDKKEDPDASGWWDDQPTPDKPVKAKVQDEKLLDLEVKEEAKVMMPFPILLEGPVGSGKSTILMELAEELGLKYYASVLTDQTSKNEFTGYKNVMNGEYVEVEFRNALEFGGMYVLEEINASTANTTIIFNTIANGYFIFADKKVDVHKDFRLCATMNTITNAKDFGGRRVLDKSVRDRFHKIMVMGDADRFNANTTIYKEAVEQKLSSAGISDMVSQRDCQRFEHMVSSGIQIEVAINKCMIQEKIMVTDKDLVKLKKEGSQWK